MWRSNDDSREGKTGLFVIVLVVYAVAFAMLPARTAFALITGGVGNAPISDPGWPKGAAQIFNNAARVAWWEGPPFGGGQYHAECRGDAKTFNGVLADFAKVEAKNKRIVVHDGVGHSFWLNPNREPAKENEARIDWVLMVWQTANWERFRQFPADLNPTDADADPKAGAPTQIDVYAGGNIRWEDVSIPKGIDVVDERLESHGFTPDDGVVLEGKITDLATKLPLVGRMRLQRVEPQKQGGYLYPNVSDSKTDSEGRWVLTKAPAGWHRLVIEVDGYVSRVVGYGQFDDQPVWRPFPCGLAKAATVSGRVTDDADRPLANVDVRLSNVAASSSGRYESPHDYTGKTDAEGRFRFEQVPAGSASVWIHKTGYCRPGLGPSFTTPKNDIALKMIKSAQLRVTVDFTGKERPKGYIVEMHPEDGEGIGKWSGSGNIDERNQISFKDVPPGKYVLHGQPNPSGKDEHTDPMTIDLQGGRITELKLTAK